MAKNRGESAAPDAEREPNARRFAAPSSLRPKEWPLRRKVAAAVLVPVALASILGFLRVSENRTAASDYDRAASQVTVLRPAIAYLRAVETAIISGRGVTAMANGAALDATVEKVIEANDALTEATKDAELTESQATQVTELQRLSEQLRSAQGYASPGQSISQLRQLQRGVNQLVAVIADAQAEPEPRLQLLGNLIDGRTSLTVQLFTAATAETGREINSVDLGAEVGVEAGAIERIASFLSLENSDVRRLRAQNATRLGVVREEGVDLGGDEAYTPYDRLTTDVLDRIGADLAAKGDAAKQDARVDMAVVLAALLLTGLLALVVSRLLLDPIRRVREGTLQVAQERLPRAVRIIRAGGDPGQIVPIDVSTHEEMGQLARAVDSLHGEAVKLAVREAKLADQIGEMFVTLSRRSTSLINQQLGLIEKLERDEEDPERLESLFRLDHLASRMRRTADSLNILADAPAGAVEARGLGVTDVVHAAIAGVQDYQRVDIDSTATDFIAGSAASDVVHLVTELTDNALSFSPPTSRVQIITRRSSEGISIQVVDAGLGMKPEMLEALNEELRSGGEVTPETARRMGMLVVSRLAKRHGITVRLERSVRGGVTATIAVPTALLRTTAQPSAPAREADPVAAPVEAEPRPLSALAAYAAEEDAAPVSIEKPVGLVEAPVATPLQSVSTDDEGPAEQVGDEPFSEEPPAALDTPVAPAATPAPPAAAVNADAEKKSALAARLQSMREARAAAGLHNPGLPAGATAASVPEAKAGSTAAPSIEDAINAVIRLPQRDAASATASEPPAPGGLGGGLSGGLGGGLPRRTPGTSDLPGLPLQPLSPPDATPVPGPGAVAPEPVAPEPVAESTEPVVETVEPIAEPVAEPVAESVAETIEPEVPAAVEVTPDPVPEPEPEPVVEPVAAMSDIATANSSILDASSPLPAGALTDEGTIFASMKSSWFSSGADGVWSRDEVDQGWSTADRVAEDKPVELGSAGLPVRRPGSRVVPGGVSAASNAITRDPEAIRARLAAHSAGVSRGRQAAQGPPKGATALDERPDDNATIDTASQESDPS